MQPKNINVINEYFEKINGYKNLDIIIPIRMLNTSAMMAERPNLLYHSFNDLICMYPNTILDNTIISTISAAVIIGK